MNAIVQFILKHGYAVLFAAIFAHQLGLPIPGPLFLLAAGALAGLGKLKLTAAIILAVVASVLADWPWYEAGRRHGDNVLHFIHRLSRDPDKHDRRAKATFARYGPSILLVSKFLPGVDAVAPPLAGTSGTSRLRFVAFDAAGAFLYACTYAGLGYVFRHDLDHAAAYVARTGRALAALVFIGLALYCIAKLVRRSRCSHPSGFQQTTSADSTKGECNPPITAGLSNDKTISDEDAGKQPVFCHAVCCSYALKPLVTQHH